MGDTKLHICMEAVDSKGDHYYMIYSLKLSDLTTTTPLSPQPTLFLEKQFKGYPSMGCGFFDSKIVFAGGNLSDNGKELHNGLISFDINSKELSSESYPLMDHGKLKPYVFQLKQNLYVCDTESGYRKGAFEYYNSAQREWHNLRQPADELGSRRYLSPAHSYGHPIVVIGSICYLTVPIYNYAFLHHPNITYRSWMPACDKPLPFSGMATYYNQYGFHDVFVISFTNGLVEAHQLDLYCSRFKGNQLLFNIPPSKPDTQMCGYFADFGDGIYSLTASDDDFLYVYTFQVEIAKVQSDKLLNSGYKQLDLSCSVYTKYLYPVNALCHGFNILGVVGCFASSTNLLAKECAERIIDHRYQVFGRRYDYNPQLVEFKGNKYPVDKKHRDGHVSHLPIRKMLGYYV